MSFNVKHVLQVVPGLVLGLGLTAVAQVKNEPSEFTKAANHNAGRTAAFTDTKDADFAHRGFLGTRTDPKIMGAQGRMVFNLAALDFLRGEAPSTANPRLWQHQQLLALHGLFQVSDHIWQVRGFDAANATFVKGDHGWIVIDTLSSTETAKAALDLVNEKLGTRPVVAVIYTHPHSDHFGGVAGMISYADVKSGRVEVIAPKGFMRYAIEENVTSGPVSQRRAAYQFGFTLPPAPDQQIGIGIGPTGSYGTSSLIPPTKEVDHTGETLTIDGVRMIFQLSRNTEAPVELNIDFPDWRIVDMAENVNTTQHNILALRGAEVRDAKSWADALTESIRLFGDSDTIITSHGWPHFGTTYVNDLLAKQRDYYAFLHDQTVRLMNDGLTGDEIAARLTLPTALASDSFNQPFYGSLSYNARAVYQFYMGFFDGNPAHLAVAAPAETARKYVAALGGSSHVVELAQHAFEAGDYMWTEELLNRAVLADGSDSQAKQLLARCYDQLGWVSENAVWRNAYLTGAKELRSGPPPTYPTGNPAASLAGLPTSAVFDLLATRLDGVKAGSTVLKLEIVFPERDEHTFVTIQNGVLIHQTGDPVGSVDATLTMSREQFLTRLLSKQPVASKLTSPDQDTLNTFASLLEQPKPGFPIVTR